MTDEILKAGVIGFPIAHSRSPLIQNYWLKLHGIDGVYDARAVEPENLEPLLKALKDDGYRGINVTVPHKEAVAGLVDEIEPFAKRVGAVNTVIVRDDGTLEGRNTDGFGFIENLKQGAPNWDSTKPAAIIGAGGAARAVIAALLDEGVPEIRLANRSFDKAQKLAEDLGGPIIVRPFEDRAACLTDAGLAVNTTTLGMEGAPPLELDLSTLADGAVATDIVYTPLETPFLKAAKQAGFDTVDGLGMLLHQARPGFEAWFGIAPKVTPMLKALVMNDIGAT